MVEIMGYRKVCTAQRGMLCPVITEILEAQKLFQIFSPLHTCSAPIYPDRGEDTSETEATKAVYCSSY